MLQREVEGVRAGPEVKMFDEAAYGAHLAAAVFDSLVSHICVIDGQGTIAAVNRAWIRYGADNGSDSCSVGIGANYLIACLNAESAGSDDAAAFLSGVKSVLDGESCLFELEYACHSPSEYRWFLARVTPLGAESSGAVIAHIDITDRKTLENELWISAKIDSLTGLPNRGLFLEKLDSSVQDGRNLEHRFAVGLIDLDRFKEINDTYGHDAGDGLLATVAQRLRRALWESDIVARLGGDEFAIVLNGIEDANAIEFRMNAIDAAMRSPIQIGGTFREMGLSAGITIFPDDADSAPALLKNADLALYEAKAKGGHRFARYIPDLRFAMERGERLRREIESALLNNEFDLVYQPIVSSDLKSLVGLEALIRWYHPKLGLLTPGSFSEAFTDKQLASAIGSRVFDLAFSRARQWNDVGSRYGRISINVSLGDFTQRDIVAYLNKGLDLFGVSARQFCLEITENTALDQGTDVVESALAKLHEAGFEIALDDFGTGFASLAHLKRLPVDRLKIDQSFVHNLEHDATDLAIVRSILELGRNLNIAVTAEGVEKISQLRILRALGSTCIQGYLIARPILADQVSAFISTFPAMLLLPQTE